MRVQDQKVANHGYTYMAPFWRENQLVHTDTQKKKKKKGKSSQRELMIWRTKM